MRPDELKEWRKRLGLTQEAAAGVFGVSRVAEQNWENGTTPVPTWIHDRQERHEAELRRRPEYGPVTLRHQDKPLAIPITKRTETLTTLQDFPTTEAAIGFVVENWQTDGFCEPQIMTPDCQKILWSTNDLAAEVERRRPKEQKPGPEEIERRMRAIMEIAEHASKLPRLNPNFGDDDLYDERGLFK